MSAYKEFEKIIFKMAFSAAELGGQTAVDKVEYGHMFHFEDKDAIRYLKENAATLSKSTVARLTGNLDETILRGVREGKPLAEITNDVRGIFKEMRGYEAERITRTEVARGISGGALAGYGSMGVKVVEYYANAGACEKCQLHHGELLTLTRAHGMIPLHPNCYCFWLPRPDITNTNIDGWRGMGEVPDDIMTGLGVNLAFRGTAMAPETATKVMKKAGHFGRDEEVRLVIEQATHGLIHENRICLLLERENGLWGFVPLKHTPDYGLIALSGYNMGTRQVKRMLRKATVTHGF